MLSFIFEMLTNFIVFKVMWKGFKMTREEQRKMFETDYDYKMRRYTGWGIILFGIGAIVLNHYLFRFNFSE